MIVTTKAETIYNIIGVVIREDYEVAKAYAVCFGRNDLSEDLGLQKYVIPLEDITGMIEESEVSDDNDLWKWYFKETED